MNLKAILAVAIMIFGIYVGLVTKPFDIMNVSMIFFAIMGGMKLLSLSK